jgi:hypothetical protein
MSSRTILTAAALACALAAAAPAAARPGFRPPAKMARVYVDAGARYAETIGYVEVGKRLMRALSSPPHLRLTARGNAGPS